VPADIIAAIHANVPMDSVATAMRDAMMPKFPLFFAVISSIIPSLSEARIMQVAGGCCAAGFVVAHIVFVFVFLAIIIIIVVCCGGAHYD